MNFTDRQSFLDQIRDLMRQNRRTAGDYQYTLPSPQSYPYQWFWDSCFHAVILSYFDLDSAKKELISVVARQFEDGMIPHMIYWDKNSPNDFPVVQWGKPDTSSITQTPLLAHAVWRVYEKSSDREFLEQMYPHLDKFYRFLLSVRDLHDLHLAAIINPDESGEDNSPRFDPPLGLEPRHTIKENFARRLELVAKNLSCDFAAGTCMSNFFWVRDVPFNAVLVDSLELMSRIATELSRSDDAVFFSQLKTQVREAMDKWMLEDDTYWPVWQQPPQKIKIKTWHLFSPLFAGMLTPKQAEALIGRYWQEFSTPYMLPTVAVSEPSYDPAGFWRGPVWMATNWLVYHGLKRYGFTDQADRIFKSSLDLVNKSGFREQFHPETGEGQGAKDFTWSGLILDMWEEGK